MGGVSMEWKEVDICQLCDSVSETYKGNASEVVLINTSDVLDGKCLNHEYVPNKKLKGQFKKTFRKGDILYSEIRPANKRFCFVDFEPKDYIASTKLMVLRAHEDVDPQYLYQILRSNDTLAQLQMLAESRSGTFPQITYSELSNIMVSLPSQKAQKNIVSILSSLDRKLELNNKINADLEEMAQAIFKNWFVDFEPFKDGKFVDSELGMIPEGWKVGTLGEFCKCLLGGTPSRSKEEYWNGEVNWINSGEINKFRILEASEKITELGLAKSATKLLPKKTTVLAITGATLGQVSLLEIDTCANQSVIGVLENAEVPYEYIYPFIKDRIEMLIQHQTGGAQQHINKDNVESLIFLLPAINVLEDYISLVSPMYKRIESQCFENLYLSTLRDTLLPRLMSGELEVPE